MAGLDSLPKDKWVDSGSQPILKTDFVDIETAILELAGRGGLPPTISYNDATSVRVTASADIPTGIIMSGFPNIQHPGLRVTSGSDGKYRENTANADVDFDSSATFWGSEKASQWYGVFGIAGDAAATFTLKAMPWMRVSSQATKTITLRDNLDAADIGYGFTTDSLADYVIYMISGASKGLLRTITNNNNNNTTGGTITYTGDALTVAQGDWFIVLPDTNFRWLGDFYNDDGSDIRIFWKNGSRVDYDDLVSYDADANVYDANRVHVPPLACCGYFSNYDVTALTYSYPPKPYITYYLTYPGSNVGDIENVFIKEGVIWVNYISGSGQENLVYCHGYHYPEGMV